MAKPSSALQGRAALVTGGARGIGKAISRRLAEAGASVLVGDVDAVQAQTAADEISSLGGRYLSCEVDVSSQGSVLNMVQRGIERFGRLDILINNAGILFRTKYPDISLEEWNEVLAVNLTGPFLCTQAVLPEMKKKRYGRIVNISSSAGRSVSTLGGAHYTASKAGLLGLTRAVAKEVAPSGITVNAVCPGLIDTPMARNTTTEEELFSYVKGFPIERLGSPEEIGDLVVFLCSEGAAYITGASIDVSGGALMI